MGRGIITISLELLRTCLHIPPETVIDEVWQTPEDQAGERFRISVRHPDLPDGVPGEIVPEIDPQVTYSWDWGIGNVD